jgi:hypothetical protein
MLIDRMELVYRYWLVSDCYRCRFESLGFLQQIVKYKCFLDDLREGQVFTMENSALQEMRTRNVLR